jgi:3-isopropylmalate/(R)-2-methylmalate dehydratase large subunit
MTLAEKILSAKAGYAVRPGDIVTAPVDHTLTYELFCPSVARAFRGMGFQRVKAPDRIAIVFDHLVPAKNAQEVSHFKASLDFAREQGIEKVHQSDGICHQIVFEHGYARPGGVFLGTDSHTVTAGAVGAFATGIGFTEMASIWGTGAIWLRVPATLRIELSGKFSPGVTAKDLILRVVGDLGHGGATYKAIEFGGPLVDAMTLSQRLTLCNMTVETGAKVGLMAADEKVLEHFQAIGAGDVQELRPDPDAQYERKLEYNVDELVPMVSRSPSVDNVTPLSTLEGMPVRKAFLGSCTNGRLEDLESAASILRGRKVHPKMELIVTPASRSVYVDGLRSGVIEVLVRAGAIVTQPGCGLCAGISGGLVADGDTLIASNNRNFRGRLGGPTSTVVLASPLSVAAAAISGCITDPRKLASAASLASVA